MTVQNGSPPHSVVLESIPEALRDRSQWVLWSSQDRNGKQTKLPKQIDGQLAKSDDPETWTDFNLAVDCYARGGVSGLGYVFSRDDPFVGIDLDGCRNPETGVVADWAQEIINRFDSYAEVSPSKTGIKIFCRGTWPFATGKKISVKGVPAVVSDKLPAIEGYDHGRYFAVTGWRDKGPAEPQARQEALEWLKKKYWPGEQERPEFEFRSDEAVIERARKYLAKLPPAVSGQGGHNATFHAACVLVLGFQLAEQDALRLLHEYNGRCEPPWNERELLHKVEQAGKQTGQRGYLRNVAPNNWPRVNVPNGNHGPEGAAETDNQLDPPRQEAFDGLAGDLVRQLEPHTEADPTAILIQAIVSFGSIIGRTAFFQVEGTRHYLNLFTVLVGTTSKGRKGTSWGRVRELFAAVEPEWAANCVVGGLASGEGLIWQIRDAIAKKEPVREMGRITGHQEVEIDSGVTDKRLLVQEAEFCSVLKQTERQGSTLSTIIRQAWETGSIRIMTKNSPAKVTDGHIAIIGHVTGAELRRYLSSTEAASGFGNRFLWAVVRRSKFLPDGGARVELAPFVPRFAQAVSFAREVRTMPRDDEAREIWHQVYAQLSADRPGLAGSLLARAEAQTMRLACLYALLDCSFQVEAKHITAALALWDYCERSTRFIFGNSTGDQVADEIVEALRQRPDGMTRNEIREMFSRNKSSERIARALNLLKAAELATSEIETTGGRPSERWFSAKGVTP